MNSSKGKKPRHISIQEYERSRSIVNQMLRDMLDGQKWCFKTYEVDAQPVRNLGF